MKQKLKTHKGTAKRVKITATGIVLRQKAARGHLKRRKTARVLRSLDKVFHVAPGDAHNVRRSLPYAGKNR
jgi:large subunit ribosomal protein L35